MLRAWAETVGLGLAVAQPPVVVALKTTASPIQVQQYPMRKEASGGIRAHIWKLIQQEVLMQYQSAWNTLLLSVKKPGTGDYRPVQDLKALTAE